MRYVRDYLDNLNDSVAAGWNRFWFTPRSAVTLGGIRIAAGLLAFYAVATYGFDLERFFATNGMLPMSIVGSLYRPDGQWLGQKSFLDYAPDALLWPAYYGSLAVLGLYALGVGGRATAIAATVVTLSFFARAPLVIGEFEAVLSFLLVYLCIGRPCDAFSIAILWRKPAAEAAQQSVASSQRPSSSLTPHASNLQPVDSRLRPDASSLNTVALRLIQIHIVVVHLMMGYAQLAAPEAAWWSGEGMWLAAGRPGMPLVDLSDLEDRPRVVAAWSHAVTFYLLAAPVLLWHRLAKPLALVLGGAIWLSVAAATGWAPLSLAMMTGLAAFVDWPPEKKAASPTRPRP